MHYGIDVGGTKTEIAIYDRDWVCLDRWREPTPSDDGEAFLSMLAALVREADRGCDGRGTLGLGFPGVLDERGHLITANLPGLRPFVLETALGAVLDRAFVIENDSRCFVVSEAGPGGAAEGVRHAFGAILGTGAGGGAIVDGRLLRGGGRFAGEWGHLPLPAAAARDYGLPCPTCGCGLSGCLETYIAGPGLVRLHRHFGGASSTAEEWHAAWRAGEPAAQRARACHLDLLGGALANVVKLLSPQVIVVGGGLSTLDGLLAALPAAIAAHLFPGVETPGVLRSRFGSSSGVRGAAMLGAAASGGTGDERL
ncbi:MAG: N-acetylglucosamine kinase [Salinicola sp.]|uniref:ROK family protein n=1 Tax=uncultured Salinicola sp. TaxID=1193542 RepID=UPI000C925C0E|nr:ROK family protein [uncultured Salinicola sp.]MAM57193.1 N-acetylglucosamine kinase [Salinicola sp.]